MYKFIGFTLMGIVAMMMIPGNLNALQGEQPTGLFYGAGTVTLIDSQGSEQYSQTIHNALVDTGEDFLLDQTFQDGGTTVDTEQIGAICISTGVIVTAETHDAAAFDTANGLTEANCKEDTTVTTTASIATVKPAVFTCGETNCTDGDVITGFAVCQNDLTDDNDYINCGLEGIMFAVIDFTTDVTLATSETLDITYTFNIESPSS